MIKEINIRLYQTGIVEGEIIDNQDKVIYNITNDVMLEIYEHYHKFPSSMDFAFWEQYLAYHGICKTHAKID